MTRPDEVGAHSYPTVSYVQRMYDIFFTLFISPSRQLRVFSWNLLSFLTVTDIVCSTYDGANVKRKCVNMSEMAYEVWGLEVRWELSLLPIPFIAGMARGLCRAVSAHRRSTTCKYEATSAWTFGFFNKEDGTVEGDKKVWMEEWVVGYVWSSKGKKRKRNALKSNLSLIMTLIHETSQVF